MLVNNKNSKIKVVVDTIPIQNINGFSKKINEYLDGEFCMDFEPKLAYRYVMRNKNERQHKAEIDTIIRENEIKEIVNSVLADNNQGGVE